MNDKAAPQCQDPRMHFLNWLLIQKLGQNGLSLSDFFSLPMVGHDDDSTTAKKMINHVS